MLNRTPENINKLKYFIENEPKVAFGQGPSRWLENNGYAEFTELVCGPFVGVKLKDPNRKHKTLQTKLNMLTFVYGPGTCIECGLEHNLPDSWAWRKLCSKKCQHKWHSKQQMGENNTCHKMTHETKIAANKKISETVKANILSGKFTPKSENYNIFGMINFIDCVGNIKSVRSSWELVFWHLNPTYEYEKLRLKYVHTELKLDRIYIVDFYDIETNTIFEIKPSKYQNQEFKDKRQACIEQGYTFITIDEHYFNSLCLLKPTIENIKNSIINVDTHGHKLSWLK